MIHDYELISIFAPTVSDEELPARAERVAQLIRDRGGEVVRISPWGRRRLAYEIDRHREGFYVSHEFRLEARAVAEIERALRLSDEIIRHGITRRPELKPPMPRRLKRRPGAPAAASTRAES